MNLTDQEKNWLILIDSGFVLSLENKLWFHADSKVTVEDSVARKAEHVYFCRRLRETGVEVVPIKAKHKRVRPPPGAKTKLQKPGEPTSKLGESIYLNTLLPCGHYVKERCGCSRRD